MEEITPVEAKGLEVLGTALSDGRGHLSHNQIKESGIIYRDVLNSLQEKGYVTITRGDDGVILYGFTENGRTLAEDGVWRNFLTER